MFRSAFLILTLLTSVPAVALATFPIDEPAYEPANARFVVGSGDGFFAVSPPFLARLGTDGAALDRDSQHVFGESSARARSVVAAAGLIVLSCEAGSCASTFTEAVTSDGKPAWTADGVGGVLVFDGVNFVVLDDRTAMIRATYIDRAGNVLRMTEVAAHTANRTLDAAGAGDGVIATWLDENMMMKAVRLGSSGRAGEPISLGRGVWSVSAIASSERGSMVVWARDARTLVAVRIDGANRSEPVTLVEQTDQLVRVAVAWDGDRYRLAWQSRNLLTHVDRVFAADVEESTLARGEIVEYGGSRATTPRIAISGNRVLFTHDERGVATYARGIDRSAAASKLIDATPRSAFRRWRRQESPAITWAGDRYTAVWIRPDLQTTLVGREFRADGTPLGPPVALATINRDGSNFPRLAATGERTLVVWSDAAQIYALAVRPGLVVEGEPVALGAGLSPDVATNGETFAVTWVTFEIGGRPKTLQGRFVDLSRPLLQETDVTLAEAYQIDGADIEWSGESYAVVIRETFPVPCTIPISVVCTQTDAFVVDFSEADPPTHPRRIASNVDTGALARAREGVVFYGCGGRGCVAKTMPHGFFSVEKEIAPSVWYGNTDDIVWNGRAFLAFADYSSVSFDEEGRLLTGPSPSPAGSQVAAASSGDGRTMIVYIPSELREIRGAILGVPARRRAVSGE